MGRGHIFFTKWLLIKIFLTVGFLAFCLGVWPGYLIHTYQTEASYPVDVSQSRWLSGKDMACQYFSPAHNWLSRVMIAVVFDKSKVSEDDCLHFSLADTAGMEVFNKDIYFEQLDNGMYFDVSIDKKLKPEEEYVWSLSLPETSNLTYAVLVTGDTVSNAKESSGMFIDGESIQENAVSQYVYYAHYDKAEIIGGFWIIGFMVWLVTLEITDRIRARFFCRNCR